MPLSVCVNGHSAHEFCKEPVHKGFEYIPVDEIGEKNHFIYAITQAAPFVRSWRLPLSVTEKEDIRIQIENNLCDDVDLLWIEIVCE